MLLGLARRAPRLVAAGGGVARARAVASLGFNGCSDEEHACLIMDRSGSLNKGRMSVRRLREATGAPLRDLLHLGLARESTHEAPCVLPRERATLVRLGGLKCVIGEDLALFFDFGSEAAAVERVGGSVRAEGLLPEAVDGVPLDEDHPFELVVLEGVLREVVDGYGRRRDLYGPVVRNTLDKCSGFFGEDDDAGIEGLHRLSAFDAALASFEAEATGVLAVLVDLLASDEDMLKLMTSERRAGDLDPERHAVVELLLESYHRRLQSVAHSIVNQRSSIAQARDLARVAIDLHRNHIIKFNLYLSMSAVGLAATTSIFGLFGMNLVSGIELHATGFAAVTAVSAVLGVAVVVAFRRALRAHGGIAERARHASEDRHALKSLLEHMGALEHLFDAASRDPPGSAAPLSPAGVSALVERASGKKPTDREIALLFEIFDADHDGTIDAAEARRAYGRD